DLIAGDSEHDPAKDVFFVGDEFQSIYRFRHADVEVFRERRSRSGGVLPLTQNYRSRPEVLAVVNELFSAGFGRRFQPLEAAERFEQELRAAGLPTYRATGRGYFGQQQVGDLLAYLRLLHNRYDDEALVAVLASPFVGVSNDALVLLRRASPGRPLFTGLERGTPETLPQRDAQLLRAFRQRYDRLPALSARLSLEQ